VDDAGAKLEARAEPVYHSIWGNDADELTLAPFTQNSGHPQSVFGNANSGAMLSPSDAQVATLVEQLRSVIRDQNRKALPNALASEKLDPSCSLRLLQDFVNQHRDRTRSHRHE